MLNINEKHILEEAINIRRALHQIPEEGLKETLTREYLLSYLKKQQIEVLDDIYATAVVALIGPVTATSIAYRADMDALMVKEETGVSYCSRHEGMMHACGHDGHMTMLLLLAKHFKAHEKDMKERVVLIFQPAEEGPGGAEGIVKTGLLETYGVRAIYGIHLFPALAEHAVGIKQGPFMAQTSEFTITVHGASAHGAQPHQGIDAIVASAALITQVQTIVSRRLAPLEPAVVTIGKLEAGERVNIIAKKAVMEGTMRSFSPLVHSKIQAELRQLCAGVATANQCEIAVEFRDMYPAVINDASLTESAVKKLSQDFNLVPMEAHMLAEDFSYYQLAVPGLFLFLGTQNTEKGFVHPLHHAGFNFDESVLLTGLKLFLTLYAEDDYESAV